MTEKFEKTQKLCEYRSYDHGFFFSAKNILARMSKISNVVFRRMSEILEVHMVKNQ